MKNIVLFHSKPGLGKSTLAKSVAEQLNQAGTPAAVFSIGERLRAISAGQLPSKYARELAANKDVLFAHAHVDDPRIIHGVVAEYLQQTDLATILIDGYPRYEVMLQGYEAMLQANGCETKLVVIIDGSDTLARERMKKRGRVMSGFVEDPAWRLKDYAITMTPVLSWLGSHYPTLHVDATLPLEQKTAEVIDQLRIT